MAPAQETQESVSSPESTSGRGKLAWLFFLLVSLHLAFLTPSIHLIPGERANIFSSILCLLSLCLAMTAGQRIALRVRSPEVVISFILLVLPFVSALFSESLRSSAMRAFAVTASGLGGFWCARLLLDTCERRVFFLWFCLAILGVFLVLAVLGMALSGKIHQFVDIHWHPTASRILLLSFAPLALITASPSPGLKMLGIGYLVVGYAILWAAGEYIGMESVVMIPAALCLLAACFYRWKRAQLTAVIGVLLVMSFAIGRHVAVHPTHVAKSHISVAYRIENIFFSWHLAKTHPLLGIGLWAPRERYLDDYDIVYPHVTKERFAQWTKKYRTSENTVLTFLGDLGFPFLLIYSLSLVAILSCLIRHALARSTEMYPHPIALLLPLAGLLLHLQVYEGLFQPQVSWFFHVLLGMVPMWEPGPRIESRMVRAVVLRALAFAVTLGLGVAAGFVLFRS